MQYFVTFLEGIITFISPCILPLLPVYISLFAGGGENSSRKTLVNALGFVLGFTIVFIALGAFAGTIGSFLNNYQTVLNIVTGLIVIFFGLNYLGVFKLNLFRGAVRSGKVNLTFPSALLFGLTFSISWTPCIGTFLGSALMLASQSASVLKGIILLLIYSVGLGIPYVMCALLIGRLKSTITWIKKHYNVINKVCGVLLIIVGIMMATGTFGMIMRLLS